MDRIAVSLPQLPDLLSKVSNSAPGPVPMNTSGSEPPSDKGTYCLRKMRTLVACYRKDETSNPDEYAAAGAAVMSEYDLEVVDFITDPRTGLPSSSKWLPTIKEIRDACEAVIAADKAKRDRGASLRKQFSERTAFEQSMADKGSRLSYDELVAKYGKDFGLGGNDPQDKADAERRLAAGRAAADRIVRAEYKSIGAEPEYASAKHSILISPALAEYGRRHAERMADHVKARSREPKA